MYALQTAAHECGHMTVLYKSGRLKGLNFFPRLKSFNGEGGVFETDTPVLTKDDCPALAASLVAELICLGNYTEDHLADDRDRVKDLSGGASLESFVPAAYEIIQKNLLFFSLLHERVKVNITPVLVNYFAAHGAGMPDKVEVVTLAEVDAVYSKSLDLLARLK